MLQNGIMVVTSGFGREVADNCALLGCYAASSGNFLHEVSGQTFGPIFRAKNPKKLDSGTQRMVPGRLLRNVGNKLALLAA
jgi:hypothetical protein